MYDLAALDLQKFSKRVWQGLLTSRSPWENACAVGVLHVLARQTSASMFLMAPLLESTFRLGTSEQWGTSMQSGTHRQNIRICWKSCSCK